jgi:hypothetical protein
MHLSLFSKPRILADCILGSYRCSPQRTYTEWRSCLWLLPRTSVPPLLSRHVRFRLTLCIVKFVWMMALGCSPTIAAKHVWYDRFDDCDDDEREATSINSTWRLSMFAFVLGALPQIIKLFAIRGIPLTQIVAAVLLANFIVIEILRLAAGTPHAQELYPLPSIGRAKLQFNRIQNVVRAVAWSRQFFLWLFIINLMYFLPMPWSDARDSNRNISYFIPFLVMVLSIIIRKLISVVGVFTGFRARVREAYTNLPGCEIFGYITLAFDFGWSSFDIGINFVLEILSLATSIASVGSIFFFQAKEAWFWVLRILVFIGF